MFENFKSSVVILKSSMNFIYSHLTNKMATALIISCSIPIIDCIYTVFFENNEDKTNDEISDDNQSSIDNYNIILIPAVYCAKYALSRYLIESLRKSIKIDNTKKLLNNEIIITRDSNEINFLQEVTVGRRVDNFVETVIPVCIGLPGSILSIASASVRLNKLISFGSSPRDISYTAGLLLVPIMANYFIGKSLSKYGIQEEEANSIILERSTFIEGNISSITSRRATDYEKKFITTRLESREKEIPKYSSLLFGNLLISSISSNLLGLCLPNNLTQDLSTQEGIYLNLLSGLLINEAINLTNIISISYPLLKDNLTKLENFNSAQVKWGNYKSKQMGYKYDEKYNEKYILTLENFGVKEETKEENIILRDTNLKLKSKTIYHLVGKSGCGKTTILNAFLQNWPYVEGKVSYACDEKDIYCVPQKLCIPPHSSLLSIILYPQTLKPFESKFLYIKPFESKFSYIKQLMQDMDLTEKAKDLNSINDWDIILSGGEKQKIALIGAIITRPKLLMLDEATSALDKVSRDNIYKVIKSKLPETTIIFTDHNHDSLEYFTDHQLQINNDKQLQICGALNYEASY